MINVRCEMQDLGYDGCLQILARRVRCKKRRKL